MKIKMFFRFTVLMCLFTSSFLLAQSLFNSYNFKNTSLDVITDAANIALGESFVANSKNHFSFFENPAALSTDGGINAFYNFRSHGWSELAKDLKYFSFGATINTSLGKLGFSYNHFTTGSLPISISEPDQSYEDINRTIILTYSNHIMDDLTFAVNIKLFNRSLKSVGSAYQVSSSNTILFDFGLLYQLKGFLNKDDAKDKLNIGLSLQNFGADYTEEYKYLFRETVNRRLPRYLRTGFAYELDLILGEKTRTNVDLLFIGEYKNFINPTALEKLDVDYWGCGIEALLLKIISLRIGGVKSPENSILFDKNKFQWRYGVGLQFPIAVLGLSHPMILKFDYALIPINKTTLENSRNSLNAFGVSLSYNKNLF